MKTTLPFSTISYNSREYLELKLKELTKARILSFWAFVPHIPEEDERKEHFHVYFEPAKPVQTEDVRDVFIEKREDEEKPRGCLPCNKTKDFGDWYYYALHDEAYLLTKSMERKYHYKRSDFVCSDEDYFDEKIRTIDKLKISPYSKILEAIEHGISFEQFLASGRVPLPQLRQWKEAYFALLSVAEQKKADQGDYNHTERNGRVSHEKMYVQMTDGRVLNMHTGIVEDNWGEVEDTECPFENEEVKTE